MPPKGSKKRAADADVGASQAKSTKTNASSIAGASSGEQVQRDPSVEVTGSGEHPHNDSDSGSDDAEMSLAKIKADPYTYIMNCPPRFEFEARYNKNHDDGSEDFDAEKASELWAEDHNGRKCACFDKNRTDGWTMMRKSFARKMDAETIEIPHRDPDRFDMYVYNDFANYGYQEVVENNMAEFNKVLNSKDGKTEELWTILESMG